MKCNTKYCRKPKAKNRTVCHSCHKKAYNKKHPEKSAYSVLKQNAKRRGKHFELTFEMFLKFAIQTEYLHGRGRTSSSFHIDRIDETKGYTIDNIQVLTNAENVRKFAVYSFSKTGKPENYKTVKICTPGCSCDEPF